MFRTTERLIEGLPKFSPHGLSDVVKRIFNPEEWRKQQREKDLANRLIITRKNGLNGVSNWGEIGYLHKATSISACEVLGLEETLDNRYKILLSLLRTHLPPSMMDEAMEITDDVQFGFEASIKETQDYLIWLFEDWSQSKSPYNNSETLSNHLHRTGAILQVLVAEIQDRANHDDVNAKAVFDSKEGIIHPGFAFAIGFLHDIARYITHSSEHDEWGERLFKELGLRKEIVDAKHKPVTLDGNLPPDTSWQMLSRLADVFGKVTTDPETRRRVLRTSVDKVTDYSLGVQLNKYYLKERKDESSMWYGRSEADVLQYISLESKRLKTAESWLGSMGLNFNYLINKINKRMHGGHTPTSEAYNAVYEHTN